MPITVKGKQALDLLQKMPDMGSINYGQYNPQTIEQMRQGFITKPQVEAQPQRKDYGFIGNLIMDATSPARLITEGAKAWAGNLGLYGQGPTDQDYVNYAKWLRTQPESNRRNLTINDYLQMTGSNKRATTEYKPAFIDNKELQNVNERPVQTAIGETLKAGTYLLPGGKAATSLGSAVLGGAGRGALAGGMWSFGQNLEEGKPTDELLMNTATGAAAGGAVGGLIGGVSYGLNKLGSKGQQAAGGKKSSEAKAFNKLTKEEMSTMTMDDLRASWNKMPEKWRQSKMLEYRGYGYRVNAPSKKGGVFTDFNAAFQDDIIASEAISKMGGVKPGFTGSGLSKLPDATGKLKAGRLAQLNATGTANIKGQELLDDSLDRIVNEYNIPIQEAKAALNQATGKGFSNAAFMESGSKGLQKLNSDYVFKATDLSRINSDFAVKNYEAFRKAVDRGFQGKGDLVTLAKYVLGKTAQDKLVSSDAATDVIYRGFQAYANQGAKVAGNLNQQAANLLPAGRGSLIEKLQSPFEVAAGRAGQGLSTIGQGVKLPNVNINLPQGQVANTLGKIGTINLGNQVAREWTPSPMRQAEAANPYINKTTDELWNELQQSLPQQEGQIGSDVTSDSQRMGIFDAIQLAQQYFPGASQSSLLSLAKSIQDDYNSQFPTYTAAEKKQISGLKQSLAVLTDLKQTMADNRQYFSPITGGVIGDVFGMADSQRAYLKTSVGTNAQQMLKDLNGAGVISNQDVERLTPYIPTLTDTYEVADSKLQYFIDYLNNKLSAYGL